MSRDSKADGHGQSSAGKVAPVSQWGSGTTPRHLQIEVTRAPCNVMTRPSHQRAARRIPGSVVSLCSGAGTRRDAAE